MTLLTLSCSSPVSTNEKELVSQKNHVIECDSALVKRLNTVGIDLKHKDFYSDAWHDYMVFSFILHNQSKKGIRAVKGRVIFCNVFGDEIHQLELSCEKEIPGCDKVKENVRMTFRPYVEKDVALKDRGLEDLEVKWLPERIIFMDNTTL